MVLDGQDGTDGAAVPQDGGPQSSAVADPAVAGDGPVPEAPSDTGGDGGGGAGTSGREPEAEEDSAPSGTDAPPAAPAAGRSEASVSNVSQDSGPGAAGQGDEQLSVRTPHVPDSDFKKMHAGLVSPPDAPVGCVFRKRADQLAEDEGVEAESVQHLIGMTPEDKPVNPELEKELRTELESAGVSLKAVNLRYDSLSKAERQEFNSFELQQAFLRTVDTVRDYVAKASTRLTHRMRAFDDQAAAQLKVIAGISLLVERQQGEVEALVGGFKAKLDAHIAGMDALLEQAGEMAEAERKQIGDLLKKAREMADEEREQIRDLLDAPPKKLAEEAKKELKSRLGEVQGQVDGFGGHLKSYGVQVSQVNDQVRSAGAGVSAIGQEASQVIRDLRQVAESGFAVKRLALLGGVIGSAVGGFFAFVVMLLLWAATGG